MCFKLQSDRKTSHLVASRFREIRCSDVFLFNRPFIRGLWPLCLESLCDHQAGQVAIGGLEEGKWLPSSSKGDTRDLQTSPWESWSPFKFWACSKFCTKVIDEIGFSMFAQTRPTRGTCIAVVAEWMDVQWLNQGPPRHKCVLLRTLSLYLGDASAPSYLPGDSLGRPIEQRLWRPLSPPPPPPHSATVATFVPPWQWFYLPSVFKRPVVYPQRIFTLEQ